MLARLWRLNMMVALLATLGITVPTLGAIGNQLDLPVLSTLPTPKQLLGEARSWLGPTEEDQVKVVRVVDGDTIIVRLHEEDVRSRLIGIDTPESVKPNTPVQCYAKKASKATKKHLTGKRVTLVYDVERTDKYGRTLAYVEVGGKDWGRWLLKHGYARTLEIEPNLARARKYAKTERKAREDGRGLWSACEQGER